MERLWKDLVGKHSSGKLSKDEEKLFKKWGKALRLLRDAPRYPGLSTHEIDSLSARYGKKVWESYLENRTPKAARMFWVYGPGPADITILALEPHPEPGAYARVKLAEEPDS